MQRRFRKYKRNLPRQMRARAGGFTMLELLVVTAIAGIVLTIGALNGRQVLKGQEEAASLRTIQQSVWQGATTAAARGVSVVLTRDEHKLILKEENGKTVRTFELSKDISTNLPKGTVLTFTPPGKVSEESLDKLDDLSEPLHVKANDKTYELTISIIGEVKAEVK